MGPENAERWNDGVERLETCELRNRFIVSTFYTYIDHICPSYVYFTVTPSG